MYKLLIYIFVIYFLFINISNANNKAQIHDVKIVNKNLQTLDFDIIGLNGRVPLKYLLSNTTLFKIEGKYLYGSNYKSTLFVEIDDTIYENNVYNTNNTTDTLYFGTNEIRQKLLESISKTFRFKFCPYSIKTGVGECTYSKRISIEKEYSSYNDTYYNYQYYLRDMKINESKKNIKVNYTPIIAIIDDGISIHHDDLLNKYWFNTKEISGNGIDDDNNGYIDDYYGWNFIDDNSIMIPKGNHGTNVAGIIGANSENNTGIVGITNDVLLMPIITCSNSGCLNKDISNSIYYAVDNGADIINLSLGGQWFGYDTDLLKPIEYAKSKGVIIVISAGNGDKFLTQKGIDTTMHNISPVCNEKDKQDIIGVSALSLFSDKTKNGMITSWSNYGACTDFYAYGDSIITTTGNGGYDFVDGTSFSAPMIAGIIGLGYNQYGKISNEVVYKSLTTANNKWHGIDSEKYLNSIKEFIESEKLIESQKLKEQEQINESLKNNKYIPIFRKALSKKLAKMSVVKLKKLQTQVDIFLNKNIKNPTLNMKLQALQIIINEELEK